MEKLKEGETLEISVKAIHEVFELYAKEYGYNKGDAFCQECIRGDWFSPALVASSDNFLDVEYRFKLDDKIYTKDEVLSILKKLT